MAVLCACCVGASAWQQQDERVLQDSAGAAQLVKTDAFTAAAMAPRERNTVCVFATVRVPVCTYVCMNS